MTPVLRSVVWRPRREVLAQAQKQLINSGTTSQTLMTKINQRKQTHAKMSPDFSCAVNCYLICWWDATKKRKKKRIANPSNKPTFKFSYQRKMEDMIFFRHQAEKDKTHPVPKEFYEWRAKRKCPSLSKKDKKCKKIKEDKNWRRKGKFGFPLSCKSVWHQKGGMG